MIPTRATAYVGLASVLVAWLAGAAGLSVPADPPRGAERPAASDGTQQLADEVQAQAARLKDRLAAAPVPVTPFRNPFTFGERVAARERSVVVRDSVAANPDPAATPQAIPEPPLQLIGIAERHTAGGDVRTAMITADSDELFMLQVGDTLGARYRVDAIGPGAVELSDLLTARIRRLSLK
jgi:hypothetical protein